MGGEIWARLGRCPRVAELGAGPGLIVGAILLLEFPTAASAQVPYGAGPYNVGSYNPINPVPYTALPYSAVIAPTLPNGALVPPPPNLGPVGENAPPPWYIIPSADVGEAYNDNVNLGPKGFTQADFITTISPGLTLVGQTPRLNVDLVYDPQALIFARGTSSDTVQQRLLGTGRAEVLREMFYLEANTSISQQFISNTGPVGTTTLTTNNNLQTVSTAGASPYLLEHLGPYAYSETRYRFSDVSTSGNQVAPQTIQEGLQRFSSGEYFGRLSWTATGDMTVIDRGSASGDPLSGTSSKDLLFRGELGYPIYQALSAIGGVGYERISDPTLLSNPKGVIWNAGLQYRPNEQLLAAATYGERFGLTDVEVNATYYPDPQLHARASYALSVQTSQSALQNLLNQTSSASTGNVTTTPQSSSPSSNAQPPAFLPGTTLSTTPFGFSSGSFLQKNLQLEFGAVRERNTYTANIYDVEQSGSAAVITPERIIGAAAGYARQVSPNLNLVLNGAYYLAKFLDGSNRVDNSYTVSLRLEYTLSRTTTASVAVSRFDTESNVASATLVTDLIVAAIHKQF